MMFHRNGSRLGVFAFSILIVCLFSFSIASAALPTDVTRIEQDWRIELQSSNEEESSPQLISGFPIPNTELVLQFSWNHIDQPFLPGGFQMQLWEDDLYLSGFELPMPPISIANDIITWTQSVAIYDEALGSLTRCLHFQLNSLQSTSWNTIIAPSTPPIELYKVEDVQTMNTYTPEMSQAESAVIFGSNHVKWFGIVETRYYNEAGALLSTDSTARVIYPPHISIIQLEL